MMASKVPGSQNAVGYWGRNPQCRVQGSQLPDQIRSLLQDMLMTNGRPAYLWQPVLSTTAGVVACTCDKDTTQNSDYKCMSCYGTRLVPGYHRFMYETLFWSSAEYTSFVLTGCERDTRYKPNRIRLSSGSTTGTIETQDKAYSNTPGDPWTVELMAFRKVAGDTVSLEWSIDSGTTWYTVTLTGGVLGLGFRGDLTGLGVPLGTGNIRFRVTMTRTAGDSAESPSFEIVRAQHVQSDHANDYVLQRDDVEAGMILLAKTWETESVLREASRGRIVEHVGDRAITSPLDFFDITIPKDTPPAALDDRSSGPHPFFEYTSGVREAQRYAIELVSLDSTFAGVMSHQAFNERRVQDGEVYPLIF